MIIQRKKDDEYVSNFDESINMIMRSNQKHVSKNFKDISCFSSISEYEESSILFDFNDIQNNFNNNNNSNNNNKYGIDSYKNGK